MFDGMPEQFYQFLAAAATTTTSRTSATTTTTATTASLSLPFSFSLHHHHHHHAASFPPYSPPRPPPPPPPPAFDASYHHLLHHPQFRYEVKEETTTLNLQDSTTTTQRLLMFPDQIPWSNDEMLALFRIRSSMDNTWFPDFIWENVSRKLAELGFKRSAEKCKEKFEEETRSFNSSIVINNNCSTKNTNYRLFGELEELCNNTNNHNNNANKIDDNNNNSNIGNDHHQQSPLHQPLIFEQNDHPQTSFSQRGEFPGGDEDDQNHDNDDDEEVVEERLGDDKERDEDTQIEDEDNEEDEQSMGDSEKMEECTKRVMRKRKRQKKFEMFKGFCEKIVNKMMVQQEELHCKILKDMVKRDEEKIAREEAWKKQEIDKLEKELEVRAHEQAISEDRQAKILDILNKFTTSNILETHCLKETLENLIKVPNIITLSNSSILTQDSISAQLQPTSACTTLDHSSHTPSVSHQTCPNIVNSSSNENLVLFSSVRLKSSKWTLPMSSSCSVDQEASQNPNYVPSQNNNKSSRIPSLVSSHQLSRLDHTSTNTVDQMIGLKILENKKDLKVVVGKGKDNGDTGRRWPRDEVLALINIRCNLFNNSGGDNANHIEKECLSKGPLWERISQKMVELGYRRSAKRCKEKWENINKYFRKTKDLNKKRSIDSRTCPYFHQLSHLYRQGTLVGPTDQPLNHPGLPENRSMIFLGAQGGSITPANGATNASHQANEGVVQVPGFDFEI